jgi:hypothetical protein
MKHRMLVVPLAFCALGAAAAFSASCNGLPPARDIAAGARQAAQLADTACAVGRAFGADEKGTICATEAQASRGMRHALDIFEVEGRPADPDEAARAICACIRREAEAETEDAGRP